MKHCLKSLVFTLGMISSLTLISCQQNSKQMDQEFDFTQDWEIFSSRDIKQDGKMISSSAFNAENVYKTDIPATVMAALVRNEVYKDIFYGDNLKTIPGEQFTVPWWYRKAFQIDSKSAGDYYNLVFEGLNYKANIWLNGTLIGAADTIEGCFRMFDIDISAHLQIGENSLAIEIFPPERGDLSIGFVDWNPWPPDNNMGLWRPVKLLKTGTVALKNAFVKPSLNTETLEEATITVSADVVNQSDQKLTGQVEVQMDAVRIMQEFTLDPHETKQ